MTLLKNETDFIFLHLGRLALEPTQLPIQRVLGFFPGGKVARALS